MSRSTLSRRLSIQQQLSPQRIPLRRVVLLSSTSPIGITVRASKIRIRQWLVASASAQWAPKWADGFLERLHVESVFDNENDAVGLNGPAGVLAV